MAPTTVFNCAACNQDFKTLYNFNRHNSRKHTNVNHRFPCPNCEVRCTTRSNLRRHLVNIHSTTTERAAQIARDTELTRDKDSNGHFIPTPRSALLPMNHILQRSVANVAKSAQSDTQASSKWFFIAYKMYTVYRQDISIVL